MQIGVFQVEQIFIYIDKKKYKFELLSFSCLYLLVYLVNVNEFFSRTLDAENKHQR
jgi:hypothetical protein